MEAVLSNLDLLYIILWTLPAEDYNSTNLVSRDFSEVTKEITRAKKAKKLITSWVYSAATLAPYYGNRGQGCWVSNELATISFQYVMMSDQRIKQPILILCDNDKLVRLDFSLFNTGVKSYLSDFILSYVIYDKKNRTDKLGQNIIVKRNFPKVLHMLRLCKKLFGCEIELYPKLVEQFIT